MRIVEIFIYAPLYTGKFDPKPNHAVAGSKGILTLKER
jgi:hypothetical protein